MTPAQSLLVLGAGALAGAINAVAGGGTLVSFPALLAVGISPVTANVTSSVGLLTGYAGGSVAYRRELEGQRDRVRALALAGVIGGVAGALLLLVTPGDRFRALVPYLILLSSLLLAVQPQVARRLADRGEGRSAWQAAAGVGIAAVYGSYFGGGLGVILLAVLGLLIADELHRLNALKGVLSLIINLAGVAVFLIAGRVDWLAAGLLAVGALVGATFGVRLARRLPGQSVRVFVVAAGIAVAVTLFARG
ncbi:MAG: hypothetical protein JWM40_2588 [Frankiales bacterium]|nr:hypothetical protein [Frankiales bacterium]